MKIAEAIIKGKCGKIGSMGLGKRGDVYVLWFCDLANINFDLYDIEDFGDGAYQELELDRGGIREFKTVEQAIKIAMTIKPDLKRFEVEL